MAIPSPMHCVHMFYFVSKHWEFGFYRKYEILNYPFHTSSFWLWENLLCLWTSAFTKSDCAHWFLGEGPGGESRWIHAFCRLKTANDPAFYLIRCFLIYGLLHETPWLHVCTPYMAYMYTTHEVMPITEPFYFPETLTHAPMVGTRPFSA